MTVIAIGGLAGGGGRVVGSQVAQRLGADYVDRLILTNVAPRVGATVEALHQREERPPTRGERFGRFLQRVLERSALSSAGGDPYFGPGVAAFLTEEFEELPQPTITRGHELEDEEYIGAIREVLLELADRDNVVIVGRGAYIILKNRPDVLRVGVVSNLEDRIANIMKRERLGHDQAKRVVEARDKARIYYFKRFFSIDHPDRPDLYHLVINGSDVNFEYATDLVVQAAAALDDGRLSKPVKTLV